MAFSKGTLITATELNSVNSGAYKTVTTQSSGWSPNYVWWSHRPNGALLVTFTINCGLFGGATMRVERLDAAGNVTNTLLSNTYGWNTHTTVNVNSIGPGRYRIRSTEGTQIASGDTWYLYAGQTDCTRGHKLTLYDDPDNSGNRLAGTTITAALLNAGRGGTI